MRGTRLRSKTLNYTCKINVLSMYNDRTVHRRNESFSAKLEIFTAIMADDVSLQNDVDDEKGRGAHSAVTAMITCRARLLSQRVLGDCKGH